jgi:hypothetical protein
MNHTSPPRANEQRKIDAELRRWCARNRNRVYVPEWLLEAWGMQVELIFKGVA